MSVQNFDNFDAVKAALPDYAKDLKLNLSSLLEDESLTAQQRCGVFLASALATHSAPVIKAAEALAQAHLSPEAQAAAKAAAAVMAMNNIYYRFVHLISDADYKKMPAKLRMNAIGRPGIEKADFELYALAVSAINGCGMCVDSHEKVLRQAGVPAEAIQTAVRIAAVLHAVARTLDGEAALAA